MYERSGSFENIQFTIINVYACFSFKIVVVYPVYKREEEEWKKTLETQVVEQWFITIYLVVKSFIKTEQEKNRE